ELDLDAAARSPAPMPLLVRDGAGRREYAIGDVGERAAGGGGEEPVIPRVADAAAEGRKPLFLHPVAERGVGRKFERAALIVRSRDVALKAEHTIAVLDIEARSRTDDAAAEIGARRQLGASGVVAQSRAAPGAAARDSHVRARPGRDRRGRVVDRCNA